MPRGRKKAGDYKTILADIDAQIAKLDNNMEKAKTEKKKLTEQRKQVVLGALLEIMDKKNITAEQAVELLQEAPDAAQE